MNRSEKLLACRPSINIDDAKKSRPEEDFQNRVLRPILKFQNDLFLKMFKQVCESYKISFESLTKPEQEGHIERLFQKDAKLKALFIGVVISLLTIDEYELYAAQQNHFNKRIIQMLMERLKDQTAKRQCKY
jgi:hypothetical protein